MIQAENAIQVTEQRMEMYAGAPREAMGVRTAGEKTAFEVQQLQNAAGRIFQEKITHFEVSLMEPVLNAMLEVAVRNLNTQDVIKVMDNDIGAAIFQTITKDDIIADLTSLLSKSAPIIFAYCFRHSAKAGSDFIRFLIKDGSVFSFLENCSAASYTIL